MPTSTDALYADHPFIERVKLTAFDERMYGARITHAFWDQLAPGWSERAEQIGISFRGERLDMAGPFDRSKKLSIIRATINAGLEQGHAVAIKVDHYNRNILYQDPYGKAAPQAVKRFLSKEFGTYTYQESKLHQQRDNISCTWISSANICAWLTGTPTDPDIQENLDQYKGRVLEAMRAVWPLYLQEQAALKERLRAQPMGCVRIREISSPVNDPIELSAFRHLAEKCDALIPATPAVPPIQPLHTPACNL